MEGAIKAVLIWGLTAHSVVSGHRLFGETWYDSYYALKIGVTCYYKTPASICETTM